MPLNAYGFMNWMSGSAINQAKSSRRRGMFWENDRSVIFDRLSLKRPRDAQPGRDRDTFGCHVPRQ